MRDGRSRTPAERTPAASAAGLSRRGWFVFAGCTAAVVVALVPAAAFLTGIPAGHARGQSSSTSQAEWAPTPDLDPQPTPLGLPPRPTPAEVATVPVQPVGSLKTGDCLQTYQSLWADGYPVIDCAAPHIAQVLSMGSLPEASGAPFPGTQTLDAQVTDRCTAPALLNWDWVAVWNEDVQTDMRYPKTAAQWASGDRSYYCFVYTFSRHELTGSAVAVH